MAHANAILVGRVNHVKIALVLEIAMLHAVEFAAKILRASKSNRLPNRGFFGFFRGVDAFINFSHLIL
jgi:hypothetical protein